MIGGERGRGGQQTETQASLNGDRGLRFFGRIGLRGDGDDDGVGLRGGVAGAVVIGGVCDGSSTGGLCGDHGENAAGAAAATAAGKRPGKNGAGMEPGTGVSVATMAALTPGWRLEGAASCSAKWLAMATVVKFCLEGSATLVAVRVTLGAEGRMAGAV